MDVMNAIHYRGNDGGRGTKLVDVVTGKMKRLLLRWITGERASHLQQLHLHIDDPSILIPQTRSEQKRRDVVRGGNFKDRDESEKASQSRLPDYNEELVIPWGHLLKDRTYKDELASFPLTCAAVAAEELSKEFKKRLEVYLHGGCFALTNDFEGMRAGTSNLSFRRYTEQDPDQFRGRLFVESSTSSIGDKPISETFVALPRGMALVLDTSTGLKLCEETIDHGESETRFVAAFEGYFKPKLQIHWNSRSLSAVNHCQGHSTTSNRIQNEQGATHGCVVLSDDTDVFFILLLADVLRVHNVLHVLSDSVYDIDYAIESIMASSSDAVSSASLYAFAGCDFLPGTFGISHNMYVKASAAQAEKSESLMDFRLQNSIEFIYETVMCLAYIYKEGIDTMLTSLQKTQKQQMLLQRVQSGEISRSQMMTEAKRMFVSDHTVGSDSWKTDVRNYVADRASSVCHLIPPRPHIALQASRARFVVHFYWGRARYKDLKASVVKGCEATHGYSDNGEVIFENKEDVLTLQVDIKNVFSFCGCKGACDTDRCSCRRSNIRCKCAMQLCLNRIGCVNSIAGGSPNPSVVCADSIPGRCEMATSDSAREESESSSDEGDSDEGMPSSAQR